MTDGRVLVGNTHEDRLDLDFLSEEVLEILPGGALWEVGHLDSELALLSVGRLFLGVLDLQRLAHERHGLELCERLAGRVCVVVLDENVPRHHSELLERAHVREKALDFRVLRVRWNGSDKKLHL